MRQVGHPNRYVRPPLPPAQRCVYMLPAEMVKAIHDFGFKTGCQSEVEAVRVLLDEALKRRGY